MQLDNTSKQILNEVEDKSEIERYLQDTLRSYIDLRDLQNPYYGFKSLTDKWNEYERCYELRAEDRSKRRDHEYKGYSNIMLSDFHDRIEILRTREVNALFSGADQFETKANKWSSEEDAILAKKLVQYDWKQIDDFRSEISKVSKDKLMFGSWIAYCPYLEEEVKQKQIIDDLVNDEGKPVIIDDIPQKTEPYEAYKIYEQKYTNIEHVDLRLVYMHPRIEDIQMQESLFVSVGVSYENLVQWEEQGIIEEGMADYIKESYGEDYMDDDVEEIRERLAEEDTERDREIKVFDIYVVYFRWGDEREIYEGIFFNDSLLAGLRKYPKDIYPFLMGQHIRIANSAYGLGVGDEIYPVYLAQNAAYNQYFDMRAFEVLGGGLIDANKLPDFSGIVPGEFKRVSSLSAMLSQNTKPILSWGELRGARSSESSLQAIPLLKENLQSASGATALLAGMPSQSPVDKTASGIKIAIKESNSRINTYLEDFEDQFMKNFAELCFKNYQDNLIPEVDLPKMLDPEDLYYTNDEGQKVPVKFKDSLVGCDFIFTSTKRIVASEERIGKFIRFVTILSNIGSVNPQLGQAMIQSVDFKFMIEEIARSLDIADLDKLFPEVNILQELLNTQAQLQEVGTQNQVMQAGIENVMEKLESQGNQTAINAINETMAEIDQAMGEQPEGPQPQQIMTEEEMVGSEPAEQK